MSLSRISTIEKIQDMLTKLEPFYEIGKIRPIFLHEKAADLPADMVREGYQWLVAVYQSAFNKVIDNWNLCKPEIWKRYFLFGGFEEHAEMRLLMDSLHNLKKMVSKRPMLFQKSKINKMLKEKK